MKNALLLNSILLATFLMSCGGSDPLASKLHGKWVITATEMNGEVIPAPNANATMEFKPDGQYAGGSTFGPTFGTWSLSGTTLSTIMEADPNDPEDFDMELKMNIDSIEGNQMVISLGTLRSFLEKN